MPRNTHSVEFTPTGVRVIAPNGLRVYMTPNMAKIESPRDERVDQPYADPAQAIGHVAEMFHIACVELAKRAA